jgi:predicted Zn-dependent protease
LHRRTVKDQGARSTEGELAAILAHEVAHVRRGHALGSIKKSRWAGVAKEALDTTVQLDAAALGNLAQSSRSPWTTSPTR